MMQMALKKPLNQLWIFEHQWPCKKDTGSDIVRNLPDLPCFHASWNAELEIVCRWHSCYNVEVNSFRPRFSPSSANLTIFER